MKKYLMSAAVLASVVSSAQANHKNFGGFYMGVNGGYGVGSSSNLTTPSSNTGVTIGNAQFASQKNNLALKGFQGGLHLGYGWMIQRVFYVGLEAYGKLAGIEGNHQTAQTAFNGVLSGVNSTWKARNNNAFGGLVRVGGTVQNVLLTLNVGVESASWKFEQVNDRAMFAAAGANGTKQALGDSKSRRLTGIPVGVGVEFFVAERWKMGLDVTHVHYTGSSTVNSSLNNRNISTNFRPRVTRFDARLSYKW